MADWPRVAATTISKFTQGFEDTLKRRQVMLALMEHDDRISYDNDGLNFTWQVEFKRGLPVGNRGDRPINFKPINRFLRTQLDYRGFLVPDAMSKLEFHMNRGKQALIKYIADMGERLMKDNARFMQQQFWNNGNDPTYPDFLHGIESMMYQAGQSININSGAFENFSAADVCQVPADTYAGLSTDLGGYGGSVAGVWPNNFQANNAGDTFDFFSPILINYNSTYFPGSTWETNCEQALRFGITASEKDESDRGIIDVVLLSRDLWRQFKDYWSPLQRINVENTKLRRLGFGDTIYLDGAEITGEFGILPGVGYGFNSGQMELLSMQKRLMVTEGPVYHMESQTYRVANSMMGNLKFYSPKYFMKLAAYNGSSF